MRFDQGLYDRQPQPGLPHFSVARFVPAMKAVEDIGQFVRRDTDPRIFYANLQLVSGWLRSQGDRPAGK